MKLRTTRRTGRTSAGNWGRSAEAQGSQDQEGWIQAEDLEKYERTDQGYEDFLQELVLSGMTPGQVRAVLAKGIPYSEVVMDRVAERIANKLREFKNRELPHDLLALYVDVKFVKVRINESVVERAVYIIGVDLEENKFVLDYEVRDREDLDG